MAIGGEGPGGLSGRGNGSGNIGFEGGIPQEFVEQLDELRDRAAEVGERVVALVRERPIASLAIAAGAGYLLGRIFR